MDTHSLQAPRIALLIDFDNVILGVEEPPGFDIELVVNALRSRGVIVLGRAYGDWYRHHRHRRKLMDHGIELVETPAFGPIIKNSADIRIALDGFEIGMTQHHITEFCLVSGDSDFLPLIKRLQYLGKTVTVISGVKFTSDLVRRNCNEFISYENLLAESVGATEDATHLEGAFALLVRTINTLHERGMEVRSSTVKQMMIQLNPVFSERTFGCAQFKQFLDKACRAGLIKLGTRDVNSGEYNVLLPGDFEEEIEGAIEAAPAAEKPARAPRRGRGRRSQSADETPTAEAAEVQVDDAAPADEASAEDVSTPVVARDLTERETSAREALRQGRLRSSGRTWKGKAKTRSILQGALSQSADDAAELPETIEVQDVSEIIPTDAAPADESTPDAPSADESTPTAADAPAELAENVAEVVASDGGATDAAEVAEAAAETETPQEAPQPEAAIAEDAPVEAAPPEAAAEVAESEATEAAEKPKRATRRRRKPAAKKAEAAADETTETPTEITEAPSTPVAETPDENAPAAPEPELSLETASAENSDEQKPEAEKKAAKKPVRRRTPRKKKEE